MLVNFKLYPSGPYSFLFARTRYVIPAWYTENKRLIRVLRLGGSQDRIVGVTMRADDDENTREITVEVHSQYKLKLSDVEKIKRILVCSLQLDRRIDDEVLNIAKKDPIVRAALNYNGWNRGKLYPSLFEATCGVICAQRTRFSRVPQMMGNICNKIGPKVDVDGELYTAFPTPHEILQSGEKTLRECGLGFRAKRIYQVSEAWVVNRLDQVSVGDLGGLREKLMQLPGVGTYTANLALNLSASVHCKNLPKGELEPHIDSYVLALISTLYFDGRDISREDVMDFVARRWGEQAEVIIGMLTTDTEEWAEHLGFSLSVRSGARSDYEGRKQGR